MNDMSYDQAVEYLASGSWRTDGAEDRRDESRHIIVDAVWPLTKENGDGIGELYDWIAEGDWSLSPENMAAWSASALAAEWDEYQRAAAE